LLAGFKDVIRRDIILVFVVGIAGTLRAVAGRVGIAYDEMVESGVNGIKISGFFRADAGCDLGTVDFFFPRFGERFVHVGANDERIGRLPGLRLVFEELEFDRKIGVMLLDEFVHAARVGVHDSAGFFVQESDVVLGGGAKAENAEMFVDGYGGGAQNLRELTASDAAEQIHLPEAVLCHDVALRFGHVSQRRSADVRNAPDVAIDGNRTL